MLDPFHAQAASHEAVSVAAVPAVIQAVPATAVSFPSVLPAALIVIRALAWTGLFLHQGHLRCHYLLHPHLPCVQPLALHALQPQDAAARGQIA